MRKDQKLAIMKDRLNTLQKNPKNIKAGGVVRALSREVRNLEKEISE